jgi:hypothetical protein
MLLLEQASKLESQMMVMGAYGHSRLGELIPGGTTRHVLNHTQLPVFFRTSGLSNPVLLNHCYFKFADSVDTGGNEVTWVNRTDSIGSSSINEVAGCHLVELRQMGNTFLNIPDLQIQVAVLADFTIHG